MLPPSFTRPCLIGLLLVLSVFRAAQAALLVVDDSDTVVIKFSGPWQGNFENLFSDPEQLNYLGTLTYSNLSGAVANFMVSGTSISVYGALFPAGTFNRVSKYTIDGKNSTVYNPPGTIASEQHRVQFYDSGTLPFGQHTLTIENLGEEYWFDFIKADGVDPTIGGPNATAMSQAASGSQTASESQTGQAALSTQGSLSTSAPSTPGAPDKSSSLTSGVIAGIVVAVAAVEALSILGALWVCRRRKHGTRAEDKVTPFDPKSAGDLHAIAAAGLPQLRNTSQQSGAWPPYHHASSSVNDGDGSTAYEPTSSRSYRDTFDTSRAMVASADAGVYGRTGPHPHTSPLAHSTLLPSNPGVKLPVDGAPVLAPPAMISEEAPRELDARREPRRSQDGGMRIAGGPPGQRIAMSEAENQSVVHTLPPSYDVYSS